MSRKKEFSLLHARLQCNITHTKRGTTCFVCEIVPKYKKKSGKQPDSQRDTAHTLVHGSCACWCVRKYAN